MWTKKTKKKEVYEEGKKIGESIYGTHNTSMVYYFVLHIFEKDHKFSHKYLSYYAISFKHIVKYLNNFPRNLLFNLHVSS